MTTFPPPPLDFRFPSPGSTIPPRLDLFGGASIMAHGHQTSGCEIFYGLVRMRNDPRIALSLFRLIIHRPSTSSPLSTSIRKVLLEFYCCS